MRMDIGPSFKPSRMNKPTLLAMDLESVLVPEIWVSVAKCSGVDELGLTTRNVADYDALMNRRIELCRRNQLRFFSILEIVKRIDPLPGALGFFERAMNLYPIVILSDTFYELAAPVIKKLGNPLLMAHSLEIDADGFVSGYRLRVQNAKHNAVVAFQSLGFRVVAIGDSHNDLAMLSVADEGFLFRPPPKIRSSNQAFMVAETYEDLSFNLGL